MLGHVLPIVARLRGRTECECRILHRLSRDRELARLDIDCVATGFEEHDHRNEATVSDGIRRRFAGARFDDALPRCVTLCADDVELLILVAVTNFIMILLDK